MLEEIKTLPPLPDSVVKIQELCMKSDTNIDELSMVIERDPMLSANILKSVNSPLYGMSKEISSIPKAIMLFGIAMIRGFAAASAIKKTMTIDLTPYNTNIDGLTNVSSVQSALVREWYRNVDKSMLPLLQSGAFLMELGKLAGAMNIIKSGKTQLFTAEIAQKGSSLEEIERKYLGSSSYEISASMFEHWNFESALTDALREISNPSTKNAYSQVLGVVARAVNIQGIFTDEGLNEAFELIHTFGLDKKTFADAVRTIKFAE